MICLPAIATTRGASLLVATPDGGMLVFDRKNATLQAFDARGSGSPPFAQDGVTALVGSEGVGDGESSEAETFAPVFRKAGRGDRGEKVEGEGAKGEF